MHDFENHDGLEIPKYDCDMKLCMKSSSDEAEPGIGLPEPYWTMPNQENISHISVFIYYYTKFLTKHYLAKLADFCKLECPKINHMEKKLGHDPILSCWPNMQL